eukprot:15314770-Alexandrium_andersonii.AAC.1
MAVTVTCHCRNRTMVMTVVVAMLGVKRAQKWAPELSGPFRAILRAERECGNENLPRLASLHRR